MGGDGSASLLILLVLFSTVTAEPPPASSAMGFIRTSCKETRYPSVCVRSLADRAAEIQHSRRNLVRAALSVSHDRAVWVKRFVSDLRNKRDLKPGFYKAAKDCLEEVSDGLDRLSQSLRELKILGPADGPEFAWHMGNVETWVSAALTDDSTCSDGFSGRDVDDAALKKTIKSHIVQVVKVTSNALALVHKMAQPQRG